MLTNPLQTIHPTLPTIKRPATNQIHQSSDRRGKRAQRLRKRMREMTLSAAAAAITAVTRECPVQRLHLHVPAVPQSWRQRAVPLQKSVQTAQRLQMTPWSKTEVWLHIIDFYSTVQNPKNHLSCEFSRSFIDQERRALWWPLVTHLLLMTLLWALSLNMGYSLKNKKNLEAHLFGGWAEHLPLSNSNALCPWRFSVILF